MELSQTLEQRPEVTPQLILTSSLLQLSSTDLEHTIAQELVENPVLELIEVHHCPRCGRVLDSGRCLVCEKASPHTEFPDQERPANSEPASEPFATWGYDDEISRLPADTTLADHLLRQIRLSIPPQDLPIATHLIDSLDNHGFLCCDANEVASLFGVGRTHVEQIIAALQQLDPVGISARDVRECLLIQIAHLEAEEQHPLVKMLVENHWEALSRQSMTDVARAVRVTTAQIQEALRYIRDNLNPFPAHAFWADPHEPPPSEEPIYPQPDIIILGGPDQGFKIDLPGARSFRLCISTSYREAERSAADGLGWEQWEAFYARGRLFINSLEQRWRTLRDLMRHLTDCQRDFIIRGEKHLQPLTRAQLAQLMGVHESTISRAVAAKYVQLPSGRIIPLAKFFDSAAPAKELIKELVAQESEPLSDREIAEILAQRGYPVARRTVTKYRNALSILPSSLRGRHRKSTEAATRQASARGPKER